MHFCFFSFASRLPRHVSAAVWLSRLSQTDGTVCPVCQTHTGQADWPFSLSRLSRHVLGRPPNNKLDTSRYLYELTGNRITDTSAMVPICSGHFGTIICPESRHISVPKSCRGSEVSGHLSTPLDYLKSTTAAQLQNQSITSWHVGKTNISNQFLQKFKQVHRFRSSAIFARWSPRIDIYIKYSSIASDGQ